jgi:seryl-tRNA synthetase
MHDVRLLRDQIDLLHDAMRRRGKLAELQPVLDRASSLEQARRTAITELELQQARRNAITREVAQQRKAGGDASALMAESRAIGEAIAMLEARRGEAEGAVQELLYELPNITLPEVPEGDDSNNRVVSSWGAPREDGATITAHWDKGAELGILDLPRGAKIAGSGFVVYRGGGAKLVRALMNMMLDLHTEQHGYEEVWVPFVVNRPTMTGTGQLPKFEEDMYAVPSDELFLIPTAEVPVTNLYRDEILELSDLPKGFCAYSACFRREAGSAGKDTRGLLRVHQFDKVELVRYTTPETSRAELETLTAHAERVLQLLELPYRRLLLAAGDTGFSSAMTYDLEVFAPGVGKWLEVSSCSVFTEFQARRANIRYRPAVGEKPRFVHTLNGSALAFSRIIASLLEHHQRPDGSVYVPEALQSYVGRATLR